MISGYTWKTMQTAFQPKSLGHVRTIEFWRMILKNLGVLL
jgi:hypothetical protein